MKVSAKTIQNAGNRILAASGVALALVVACAGPAVAQRGSQPVHIDTGGHSAVSKSIVLPLDKAAIVELPQAAADVLVSQPSVVDAVIRTPRRVYLLGMKTGQTNAFFFDAQGRQILNLEIVVERDLDALSDLIKRIIPDARIDVEAVNDNVILRGVVQDSTQAANVAELASRFIGSPDQVVSLVKVRESEQVLLKVRIVEMQRSLVKQLGVDLNGVASFSDSSFEAAVSAIASGATAGLAGSFSRFIGSGGDTSAGFSFQALERAGLVRTLAEPNLTAVSGESAKFLAGGEFPVPIGQRDGVISIDFKEFGVGLGFSPVVLNKGRISLKIETEVSEITSLNNFSIGGQTLTLPGTPAVPPAADSVRLVDSDGDGIPDLVVNDTSVAAGETGVPIIGSPAQRDLGTPAGDPTVISTNGLNIPALAVRRANTTVEMPSGGSLVMAGLLQENIRNEITGIPGAKDIPILGQLFRSRDFQSAESELVIIVTPYLVDPTHESKLTDPAAGFAPATDIQSILFGKLISTYGLAGAGVGEKNLQGPIGFILD